MNNFIKIDFFSEALQKEISFQSLHAGETLFKQNDEAVALFVVETGRIKLVRYTSEQQTSILEVVGIGEILGETALFSDTYSSTAIADLASRVIVYPKQPFLSVLRKNPEIANNLIAMLVKKNQFLKFRLELLNIRSAHERVLFYIRYLVKSSGKTAIELNRSFKDVANELNITPETLSRALLKLEQEGAITRRNRTIVLNN